MTKRKKALFWLFIFVLVCLIIYLFSLISPEKSPPISYKPPIAAPQAPIPKPAITVKTTGPIYLSVNSEQRPGNFPTEPKPSECLLTGKVISERGEPLPGAMVSIYAEGPDNSALTPIWPDPVVTGVCNSEGRYTIHLLEFLEGAFVRVHKPGFGEIQDRRNFFALGEYAKDYTLREACACIEGVVIADGKPIAGARVDVSFARDDVMDLSTPMRLSGMTDSLGRYRIDGLIEGYAGIGTQIPGFQRRRTGFNTVRGPCGMVVLKLEAGQSIPFAVKSTQGHPIIGAAAFCQLEGPNKYLGTDEYGTKMWTPSPLRGQANEGGIIDIVVPPDTALFDCRVSARKYQTVYIAIDPNSPPHEVVLEDAVQLKGVVLSGLGAPVPAARVWVYEKESVAPPVTPGVHILPTKTKIAQIVETETDMHGRFQFDLPFSTLRRARVIKKGFRETRVELNNKEPTRFLEVRLESEETGIYGTVVNSENSPVNHFTIVFTPSAQGGGRYSREIDDTEGRFLVTDVPAGTYTVSIIILQPTFQFFKPQEVTLKSGFLYGEIRFESMHIEALKK